ncbi:MAG: type II secretion system protein [Parcubacteria group bacterium]
MFKKNRGFTLVELMVAISIVILLMSVVLFNYFSVNGSLSVSSAAQELAISIREAQFYGLNVKQTSAGRFDSAYGVYFNPGSNPSDYIIFVDSNTNPGDRAGRYDAGNGCGSSSTECVERVNLRDGVTISGVCNDDVSESNCSLNPSLHSMHIVFKRPEPDASISFANGGGIITSSSQLVGKIYLRSQSGNTAYVFVRKTGQIMAK